MTAVIKALKSAHSAFHVLMRHLEMGIAKLITGPIRALQFLNRFANVSFIV